MALHRVGRYERYDERLPVRGQIDAAVQAGIVPIGNIDTGRYAQHSNCIAACLESRHVCAALRKIRASDCRLQLVDGLRLYGSVDPHVGRAIRSRRTCGDHLANGGRNPPDAMPIAADPSIAVSTTPIFPTGGQAARIAASVTYLCFSQSFHRVTTSPRNGSGSRR